MTPEMIAEILETVMILAFGLSWPLSIYKSVKSRTAKGKSLQFEIFIWLGYIAGIVMKCIQFFVIGKSGPIFVLSWVLLLPELHRDHHRYASLLPQREAR